MTQTRGARRTARWRWLAAGVAVSGLAAAAMVAPAYADTVRYVHPTTTTGACHVYSNFPKDGVADYGWDVGGNVELDVRFTFDGYSLVKDPARSGDDESLHYGFVQQECLVDPHAYNNDFTTALQDQQGVGGDGSVEYVDMAPTPGTDADTIHVTSPGTIRSDPGSFPIGNVRVGDAFHITTATCGHPAAGDFIFGRDDNSGRWGWVEALHFSACGY